MGRSRPSAGFGFRIGAIEDTVECQSLSSSGGGLPEGAFRHFAPAAVPGFAWVEVDQRIDGVSVVPEPGDDVLVFVVGLFDADVTRHRQVQVEVQCGPALEGTQIVDVDPGRGALCFEC